MAGERELTYGEKAVGLTFNPSGDEKVTKLKKLFAEIIDLCNDARAPHYEIAADGVSAVAVQTEHGRLYSIAITEAQAAQMWAVKAATWR